MFKLSRSKTASFSELHSDNHSESPHLDIKTVLIQDHNRSSMLFVIAYLLSQFLGCAANISSFTENRLYSLVIIFQLIIYDIM